MTQIQLVHFRRSQKVWISNYLITCNTIVRDLFYQLIKPIILIALSQTDSTLNILIYQGVFSQSSSISYSGSGVDSVTISAAFSGQTTLSCSGTGFPLLQISSSKSIIFQGLIIQSCQGTSVSNDDFFSLVRWWSDLNIIYTKRFLSRLRILKITSTFID